MSDIDPRIIDFENWEAYNYTMPDWINDPNVPKRMMLACGDGYGEKINKYGDLARRILTNSHFGDDFENITDIELISAAGYNIFCCFKHYDEHGLSMNIEYMLNNPDLKILLCFIDLNNKWQCDDLGFVFENKIDILDTDDTRVYIPVDIAYKILKPEGKCMTILPNMQPYKDQIFSYKDFHEPYFKRFNYSAISLKR